MADPGARRVMPAGLGVALPAVAFEVVASGDRSAGAVVDGSAAAFLLRFVVLCGPILLVLRPPRSRLR